MSAHSPPILSDGVAHFYECCRLQEISRETATALVSSISKGTLLSYKRYWAKFSKYVNQEGNSVRVSIPLICKFLLFLFEKGLSSSSLNVARSALSFFMCNSFNLTEDRIVARLFRYFYLHRPLKAKYFVYWPVSQLLNHLSDLHPICNLTLKELTNTENLSIDIL